MSEERRVAKRIPSRFKVEMTHPTLGTMLTQTRDISEQGAFILTHSGTNLPLNTKITLRVIDLPGPPAEPVESEVVRIEKEGVGVKFLVGAEEDPAPDEPLEEDEI